MRTLLVSGSSGGHIFPALSLIEKIKLSDPAGAEYLLVLPNKSAVKGLESQGYKVAYISFSNLKGKTPWDSFVAVWNLLKAFVQSFFILASFKPDVAVGFGSLASLPVIFWGWIFRTKILLHEQNALPGQANRFLARFADKIALSFEESRRYLERYQSKLVVTGNPIRSSLKKIPRKEALDFLGFSQDRFTILMAGGSQGSHALNVIFPQALSYIKNRKDFQVIHLAGETDLRLVQSAYNNLGLEHKIFVFLKQMEYAYSIADLIISRAGATTLSEIMFYKIPALIVPYPFAKAHQQKNVRALEEKGCAIVFQEKGLEPVQLARAIESLVNSSDKLLAIRRAYAGFIDKDSAEDLYNQLKNLCAY